MNTWNDTTVAILSANNTTPVNLPAKELSFTGAHAETYLPLVAFVTSNGNVWIGPKQSYYFEESGSVTGIYFGQFSRFVEWFDSASFAGQANAGIGNNTDLMNFLDNQVTLAELEDASKPENCTIVATDLVDCFADYWFFAEGEDSAHAGQMKISAITIENSDFRLEIENETSGRTGVVWIGTASQDVVQATENGTTTFPASGSN